MVAASSSDHTQHISPPPGRPTALQIFRARRDRGANDAITGSLRPRRPASLSRSPIVSLTFVIISPFLTAALYSLGRDRLPTCLASLRLSARRTAPAHRRLARRGAGRRTGPGGATQATGSRGLPQSATAAGTDSPSPE